MVWSRPMGTARSSSAWWRTWGGMKRARDRLASASSTRRSRIPCSRTWRAMASPGAGSGGLGLGMVARLGELEVLDLELDLAPAVPLVELGVEGHRAGRAGGQLLRPLGQVPADRA